MQIDLLANSDYLYGDITNNKELTDALVDISPCLLNRNAGVRAAFSTNSNSVSICYTIDSKDVIQHIGRSLTNGICYAVLKDSEDFLVKAECVYKSGEEEEIFLQTKNETYFYQLFLPSFNKVKSLFLIIDDDATVSATSHLIREPIVFMGGNMTLGHGCTFASVMYSQIISRNTKRDFYNLSLPSDDFLNVELAANVKLLNPSVIVSEIDCPHMSLKHLRRRFAPYIKKLIKTASVPIIMFSQAFWGYKTNDYDKKIKHIIRTVNKLSKKYPDRIVFINGKDIFSNYNYDEYTFSTNFINDNGNAILADYLTPFIGEACI